MMHSDTLRRSVGTLLVGAAMWAVPSEAGAQAVSLSFDQGLVTLSARGVPLREVLDKWAQVGRTTIINSDQIQPLAVTLDLVKVPESEALGVLLRSLPGYLLAARPGPQATESSIDRIVVLAARGTPAPAVQISTRTATTAAPIDPSAPSARVLLPEPDEASRDGLVIIGATGNGRPPSATNDSTGAKPRMPPNPNAVGGTGSAAAAGSAGASGASAGSSSGRPGEVAPAAPQPSAPQPLQRTGGDPPPPPGGRRAPSAE